MRGKRSTIVLFIGGLPADVSNKELKAFVRTTLKASGVKSQTMFSEPMGGCNILRITDAKTGKIEFHGLVEIRPAAFAMRAIDILNEVSFRGSPLKIHRYRQRSPLGRNRKAVSDVTIDKPEYPEPGEQRRPALKIELVESDAPSLLQLGVFDAKRKLADH